MRSGKHASNYDLEKMPMDDASVVWPKDLSPYIAVARISAPLQQSWSGHSTEMEDGQSYSPWHCLAAHRPLGSINRVPKKSMKPWLECARAITASLPPSRAHSMKIAGLATLPSYVSATQKTNIGGRTHNFP